MDPVLFLEEENSEITKVNSKLIAWLVHLFTASAKVKVPAHGDNVAHCVEVLHFVGRSILFFGYAPGSGPVLQIDAWRQCKSFRGLHH